MTLFSSISHLPTSFQVGLKSEVWRVHDTYESIHSFLLDFYLFSYAFDFLKCLLNSNTCLVVLQSLSLVCKVLYNLLV